MGRTAKQCRQRWFYRIRPSIRRGKWTASVRAGLGVAQWRVAVAVGGVITSAIAVGCALQEDEALRKAVAEFGTVQWTRVAERVPLRTSEQCLNRYYEVLDQRVKHGGWTPEVRG